MQLQNNFCEVFSKLNLSKELVSKLKDSNVTSVFIYKKLKKLDISIIFYQIINLSYLNMLKSEIFKNMPYLNDVNINIKYYFFDMSDFQKIEVFWPNLIYMIKNISPFAYNIFEKSTFNLIENNLQINVKHNTSFIFFNKKLDKFIENILNKMLELKIKVFINDMQISDDEREKHYNMLVESQMSILNSYKNENILIKKNDNESSNDKYKFRTKLKINDNLKLELGQNIVSLSENISSNTTIIVKGEIFQVEIKELKTSNYLIIFHLTDLTSSITIKFFCDVKNYEDIFKNIIKKGNQLIVKGDVVEDNFSNEINIMAKEICQINILKSRKDLSDLKRVELHLHTQMSSMDGVCSVTKLIECAQSWGHSAIAITDHGVLQAFPEALEVSRKLNIKIIYGLEAYLIDDLGNIVENPKSQIIDSQYTIFNVETLKKGQQIFKISAIKFYNNTILDNFETYVNPQISLHEDIEKITKIPNSQLQTKPNILEAIHLFLDFAENSILIAYDAFNQISILRTYSDVEINNTIIDILELSKCLFEKLEKINFNNILKHLCIEFEEICKTTFHVFLKCIDILKNNKIENIDEINILSSQIVEKNKLKTYHAIILVKNYVGLKNLYELVSDSHIKYFYRRPRIPKSEFLRLREGLIIGTACEAGEFFKAIMEKKPAEVIKKLADFYDYFEIQPLDNNRFLLKKGKVNNIQQLININKEIVRIGELYKKPVVATCDVHFLDPNDEIYRKIIMHNEGFKDTDSYLPLYFRTTSEMIEEFSYLGNEKAKEVVITNTNFIANQIEKIKPIPDETYPPKIDGSDEELRKISIKRANEIYGNPLPQIVEDRLERELSSIIKNGFSVMYIIAQKLVWKSLEDGYLVGSRGSVGSSFVATMSGITEVNPLSAHYFCEKCKYSDFDSDVIKSYKGCSGYDMPDIKCPICNTMLKKDGHDIPFETFLGFDGDKEPDIDLNFSGEYQAKAHAYTEELFGKDYVFKAGTIGTIAEKTAFGFVKKYIDDKSLDIRTAEINRLKLGCTGIKRTTGQHPGGLMIVPNGHSIYEFCPVQRPANDLNSNVITTHFDYHSISGRLLKLDILGHDVPTIIRYLHDTTGIDPISIDLGNKKILSLFTTPEALGVTSEDINCKTGTLGLPEFGTSFVRQMLVDTKPSTFSELVRISGLSHGTDVWFNNAQDIIKNSIATLKEVIPTRDDIMVYLINMGVEKKHAFKIMESVRKGKGLSKDEENVMHAVKIPEWYIESCKKIKYMFPKGHAVAYVMMTVRIGFFKIYYPYSFYGASFSVKSEDFDYELMCQGINKVRSEINKIVSLGKSATTKEKSTLTILELVLEMYARGLKFLPLDLYESDATKFIVKDDGLLPPLCSIQGLGLNAALGIVNARNDGEFVTIEDFRQRTKTTKTVISLLKDMNILKNIPESNQLTLF